MDKYYIDPPPPKKKSLQNSVFPGYGPLSQRRLQMDLNIFLLDSNNESRQDNVGQVHAEFNPSPRKQHH